MDTDVSYNEDFIILSSTIEEKTEDGIIYSNLCQYHIMSRIINLIDKLIETNDLGLISNIYESLNEDVENKLKAEDLLGKYIKLLKSK